MLHAGLDLSRKKIDVCLLSPAGEIVDEWASPLSWMRFVEQSFSSIADVQKAAGTTGDALSRLRTAQAAFVRDTARVYRSATTHLAR